MIHTKKKSLLSNNKVIESAWDAYLNNKESNFIDELHNDGWLSANDISLKLKINRSTVIRRMRADKKIENKFFNVYINGNTRKLLMFKIK